MIIPPKNLQLLPSRLILVECKPSDHIVEFTVDGINIIMLFGVLIF
jgi:hypothetical protein